MKSHIEVNDKNQAQQLMEYAKAFNPDQQRVDLGDHRIYRVEADGTRHCICGWTAKGSKRWHTHMIYAKKMVKNSLLTELGPPLKKIYLKSLM